MDKTKKFDIVIGGGIAGIVISHLLNQSGSNVILLEKDSKLGGLLNSKLINGSVYDHGTHLLKKTGKEKLDDFLFSGLDYYEYPYIKSGSFHNVLFDKNGFLSDFSLPEAIRLDCLNQLVATSSQKNHNYNNLESQLIDTFGIGYYCHLFKPIIEKLFFQKPSELAPDSHALFGLSRLVLAESLISKELKENSHLDKVIAYYSYLEGLSLLPSMYPKSGGTEAWINILESKIRASGVQIELNTDFDFIVHNYEIKEISINEFQYPVNNIYCTIPSFFLYSKIPISKPVTSSPKRLSSIIIDIKYLGNLSTDLYYIHVYDPNYKSFRVTLYDNFDTCNSGNAKRITVEFLTNEEEIDLSYYSNCVKTELYKMGIISAPENLIILNAYVIKGGFPVPTAEFLQDSEKLNSGLQQIKNLKIYGKASGKSWFMNDVLLDIYNSLTV